MLKDKSFLTSLTVFVSAVVMLLLILIFNSVGYGKDFAFYSLSLIIVSSAIGVVTIRNLVHSGFLLVLSFVTIAGIYLTLNADFLAAAQILINGGAVTIMMIFAIWLTNSRTDTANQPYSGTYRYVAFVFVGLGLFLVLFLRMTGLNFNFSADSLVSQTPVNWPMAAPRVMDTTVEIGTKFFNEFLIPFEIASVILLMALIGAIVLAMKTGDIKKGSGALESEINNSSVNENDSEEINKVSVNK